MNDAARLNPLDRLVAWFDPRRGVRRAQARRALAYYEAAKVDRLHKSRRETGSGNDAILRAGASLRQLARHFEQNHDIALGVLNTLVNNTIGPHGIGIEPQPRRADGSIDDTFARELLELWRDWQKRPEVTWLHDWAGAQRMLARAWFRDGEVLAQTVEGRGVFLDHGTRVPLSLEMLEADYLPIDRQSATPLIVQGIELNQWGRPVAYHVARTDPANTSMAIAVGAAGQTKRIPAERMLHLAVRHRIGQLRGVSVFASVLQRLDDLKDYEESERIAAKVAASMAAFIKKGAPDAYEEEKSADGTDVAPRTLKFRPGMVFDDLKPGEEIGTIDTSRPNPNLEHYRGGQLRAIAAGTGPTYSSVARNYNGTYSAQRQELVEGWATYGVLQSEFIAAVVRPVYEKFVALAVLAREIRVPAGIVPATVDDALYLGPAMPWIDPEREANAWAVLEKHCHASGPEIIRRRGANPVEVLEQQARWRREKEAAGVPVDPDAPAAPAPAEDPPPDPAGAAAAAVAAAVAATAPVASAAAAPQAGAVAELAAAVTALATREQPAPHITFADGAFRAGDVHVAPASVHVEPPEVHVAAPSVHVDAPAVSVAAPEVHVAAPNVTVPQGAIAVEVKGAAGAAPEAPRPWATETRVLERDDAGRAKVFETRPIEDTKE